MDSSEAIKILRKKDPNEPMDFFGMVIQPLQLQACQAHPDVLVALCPSGRLWADIQDRWPAADNASRLTDENPLTGAGEGSEGNLL